MTRRRASTSPLAERVFRLLLKSYPPHFRQRYGDDLLAFFLLDRERNVSRGRIFGSVRFWLRTITDTVWAALCERMLMWWQGRRKSRSHFKESDPQRQTLLRFIPPIMWDLRFAFRSLKKSPWFVVVAVVSLGLALGLTNTTFAVLDAVKNPYTPMAYGDRVYAVRQWGDGASGQVTSFQKYEPIENQAHFYDDIAMTSLQNAWLSTPNGMEYGTASFVSPSFFSLVGVGAQVGRLPELSDGQATVVSLDLWRRLFSGTALRDARLTIGEQIYQVVGVMPRGMNPPYDAWVMWPRSAFTTASFSPLVRLKPEVPVEMAYGQLESIVHQLERTYGTGRNQFGYQLRSVQPDRRRFRDFHFAMGGAAIAVLLLACANLANLSLARGFAQRRELAVRMAIGASRIAVMRQMLAEGIMIAAGGGVLGFFTTLWGIDLLRFKLPQEVRTIGWLEPYLNWRVAIFAFGVVAVTVILSSLFPAVRVSRVDLSEPLKNGSPSVTERIKGRYNGLVIAEVAVAMVLVLGAGLLMKAAERVSEFEFGYNPEGIIRGFVNAPEAIVDYQDVLAKVKNVPGVEMAALLGTYRPARALVTSDVGDGNGNGQMLTRGVYSVTSDFFKTLGVQINAGRDFLPGDGSTGAVIVDEDAAKLLWPDAQAVGQMVKFGPFDIDGPWYSVVGMTDNVAMSFISDPDLPPEPKVYVVSDDIEAPRPSFVARLSGNKDDMLPVLPVLQKTLMDAVPGRSFVWLNRWGWQYDMMIVQRQFLGTLFGLLGAFGLVLSSVGLYSVLAYTVVQRTREFGIRVALGAEAKDVLRHVFHDAFVMILAGIGVGAFLAMWSAQIFGKWLYNVHPADATALVITELVLISASCLACLAPAIKAMRANPIDVLRAT